MHHQKVRNILRAAVAAAALALPPVFAFIILGTDWPLGGARGQWEWFRTGALGGRLEHHLVALGAFAAAALIASRLDRQPELRRGAKCFALMAAIALAGLAADCALLRNGRAGVTESAVAILNPFATGYLESALTATQPGDLTGNFARRVLTPETGEVPLHRHVHPPGNVLLTAAALHAMPSGLGSALLPDAAADLRELGDEKILLPPMDGEAARHAALNLTVLFIAALTAGKLLLLGTLYRLRARLPGLSSLFVVFGSGAGVLFLGHYDVFYFFLASLALFFALEALKSDKIHWALLTGVTLGVLATFTLGAGAVILLAALVFACSRARWRLLAGLGEGGLMVFFAFQLAGLPLIPAALQCWENHRAFCAAAGRGYRWVWFNAFDALLFAGVAASLAIFGVFGLRRDQPGFKVLLAGAAVWLFLIFSGSARGEFGRLVAIYTPVLLCGGAWMLGRWSDRLSFYRIFQCAILFAFLQTMLLRDTLKLILIE